MEPNCVIPDERNVKLAPVFVFLAVTRPCVYVYGRTQSWQYVCVDDVSQCFHEVIRNIFTVVLDLQGHVVARGSL